MERLSACSSAGDYGVTQDDETTLSDSGAVKGARYFGAAAGGQPADDAGGDPSTDTDLEDNRVPGVEDVCASRVSFAVAGWFVPAGDASEEDAVWIWWTE